MARPGLTVVNAAGELRQLIDKGPRESIGSVTWAPDGNRLALQHLSQVGGRAAVVDLEGPVTYPSGDDDVDKPIAWTPDGQIVYSTVENRADGVYNRVRIVSSSGGAATTLWDGCA